MEQVGSVVESPQFQRRFTLVEVIGEGAAGIVYRVLDHERDGEEIALKVLVNTGAFDENTIKRFRHELMVCQELRHPNIVAAYDLLRFDRTLAYSMEYVPGKDLGLLLSTKRFTYAEIDSIMTQLLSALSELHSHSVWHRDVKLENILYTSDGLVKLSDLGLMKGEHMQQLTKTGVLLGTAQYFPPEYIREGKYDQRSDLYAAGVVLYELVTGERRLGGMNGNEVIQHLLKNKFKIPELGLSGPGRKYERIIQRALQAKPKKRYQRAEEMQRAFDQVDEESDSVELRQGLELTAVRGTAFDHIARRRQRSWRRLLYVMVGAIATVTVLLVAKILL